VIHFDSAPPTEPNRHALPIKRTPTGRAIVGIITCHDLIGTNTHFHRGRTRPCTKEDCPACGDGIPFRWHGYVSLWNPKTKEHVILELTARMAERIAEYRQTTGTLRGARLRCQRVNLSPNAKAMVEIGPENVEALRLPPPPDLVKCMATIWNFSHDEMTVNGTQKDLARVDIKPNHALRTFDPQVEPDNLGGKRNGNLIRPA